MNRKDTAWVPRGNPDIADSFTPPHEVGLDGSLVQIADMLAVALGRTLKDLRFCPARRCRSLYPF